MTCDNKAATNEELLEKFENEWKEMWKDNPPKYEGKIFIGGNGEGFTVASSISPAMYPHILITMQKSNPEAFSEAISIMNMRNMANALSNFLNGLAESSDNAEFDSGSEESAKDETPEAE